MRMQKGKRTTNNRYRYFFVINTITITAVPFDGGDGGGDGGDVDDDKDKAHIAGPPPSYEAMSPRWVESTSQHPLPK